MTNENPPISARQYQMLQAVAALTVWGGSPPTYTELACALRVTPERARQLAIRLLQRGYLSRDARRLRCLRVTVSGERALSGGNRGPLDGDEQAA